jgi:hypothetical protein
MQENKHQCKERNKMRELSRIQFDILQQMIEVGSPIVLIQEPLESDPAEAKRQNSAALADLDDIVEMGFLTDISEEFKDCERVVHGYMMTEAAIIMFHPAAAGGVN